MVHSMIPKASLICMVAAWMARVEYLLDSKASVNNYKLEKMTNSLIFCNEIAC